MSQALSQNLDQKALYNVNAIYGGIKQATTVISSKNITMNQTAFMDTFYPKNGTTIWPLPGNTTDSQTTTTTTSVPWDASAKIALWLLIFFVIQFLVASIIFCRAYRAGDKMTIQNYEASLQGHDNIATIHSGV